MSAPPGVTSTGLGPRRQQVSPADMSSFRLGANFALLSVCFSLAHGSVVAVMSLAAMELGALGALSTGILYASFVVTNLTISTNVTSKLGPKGGVVAGFTCFLMYVLLFTLAVQNEDNGYASLVRLPSWLRGFLPKQPPPPPARALRRCPGPAARPQPRAAVAC